MRKPLLLSLTAAATLALTLTACGGSGGSGSGDKISGANSSTSASASPSPSPSAGAPTFDLPSDVKVVIDEDKTGDKAKDAILRDHAYALMAMQESYAKGSDTANFKRFWNGYAGAAYAEAFADSKKKGLTISGADRFYNRVVQSKDSKSAVVTFCEDQSKAFDKEVKSGKVFRNAPSLDSFIRYRMTMEMDGAGDWQVATSTPQERSTVCQGAA
jgi:hypothetical protein